MRIALIDIGVSKDEIENWCKVQHFSLHNGKLVEKYKEPKEEHGTRCFKEIVLNAQDTELQILDLNISDDAEGLQVSSIVTAIKKAIEERVDMINISLGVKAYSQELYDICEEAGKNNIIILSAASHTNTVSFPADLNNVICVKVDQKQTEKIKAVGPSTVSVPMRDYIITENGAEFDFSSSSMACARVCGYLCCILDGLTVADKAKVLTKEFNLNLHSIEDTHSRNTLEESKLEKVISDKKVAIVLFPADMVKSIRLDILDHNIVAYYDYNKGDFYSFSDGEKTDDFEVIMLLNSLYTDLQVPLAIKEKYKNYRIIYVGNFVDKDNNDLLHNYNMYNSSEMTVLERPVIAIAGLCSGLNKADVQISILNSLKADGLDIKAVSNNPIGLLYNMDIFNYPTEVKFPEIVYSINRYMYLTEIHKNPDAWLINIGGAIGQVNNLNTYNFGKLADAYFSAANIDVAILCVNAYVDVINLKFQLADFYKHGIDNIFIVLSHNDIDATTMDYKDGLQTYLVDDKKYLESFEYLQSNIKEKVFTIEDVQSGKLYDNIIAVLS